MKSNPSLSWQKLQDVYYSIRTCYDGIRWPVDNLYANCRIAMSSPLTLIATASKFVPNPNVIDVHSISGTKIWSLVYNSSLHDHIVDFCFHNENLCVVLSNQKYRVYTDFEGTFNEYSYTEELAVLQNSAESESLTTPVVITNLENNEVEEPYHIEKASVCGEYLVLRNRDKMVFCNLNTFANYEVQFPNLPFSRQSEMCILSSTNTSLSFILSYEETIMRFEVSFEDGCFELVDEKLTVGPFSMMSALPNGSLVALLNESISKIYVITKDLDKILLEYDTSNESSLPYMVEWAGNDAIVLSLRDEIKLIGPGQKSVSFFYDIIEQEEFSLENLLISQDDNDLSFIVPVIKCEEDGLKIISKDKVEFLSRVPDCSVKLHLTGSSHPSLILLDCVDKLASQASKADSNISFLKSERLLDTAISSCLEASLEEFDAIWQQTILKAVSFGKIYCNGDFCADEYLHVMNTIKVLNQLRTKETGLFLSYKEIVSIGWHSVVLMLLKRSQHLLAMKVADLLQLEESRSAIYIDWCQKKVRKELNMSDEDLFIIIAQKLLSKENDKHSIIQYSVTKIFDVSFQEGRIELCKLLVDLEPSGSSKMKQLLLIKETELALIKCFQSCNYDLCKLLFLHLTDTRSTLQIFQIINQNEIKMAVEANTRTKASEYEFLKPFLRENLFVGGDLVGAFFQHSIASTDPTLLQMYLKYEDKSYERDVDVLKSLRNEEPTFDEGEEFYNDVFLWYKQRLAPVKNSKRLKKIVSVETNLLDLQHRLSNTFQRSFFETKSVVEIIKKLVGMNQIKLASRIVKDVGITQEKFWQIALEVFCKAQEFDRLHKFITAANSGNASNWKSPIGFMPIVKSCLAYNAPKELISTYIGYCTDLTCNERVELSMANDDYLLAGQDAFKNKDAALLRHISAKAGIANDTALVKELEQMIRELGG